jgi:hypothetical protein
MYLQHTAITIAGVKFTWFLCYRPHTKIFNAVISRCVKNSFDESEIKVSQSAKWLDYILGDRGSIPSGGRVTGLRQSVQNVSTAFCQIVPLFVCGGKAAEA